MSKQSRNTPTPRGDVPRQLDPDMAERVREIRRTHGIGVDDDTSPPADAGESGGGRDRQVTPDTCALMRYMAEQVDAKKRVAEAFAWVSYDRVLAHVNGECSCDEITHVHYDECMRMRLRARKGAPARTLALLNDIEVDTVWVHIGGRCSHEDGIRPLPTSNGPTPYPAADAD